MLLFTLTQCEKTPEDIFVLEPYAETSLDTNGGSWKTFVLANGSELAVAAPEATNSATYQAELADLKNKMAAATAEQKDAARYWAVNAVLRWHEFARELAAPYNTAPNYNPDATYPRPDPNKPTT